MNSLINYDKLQLVLTGTKIILSCRMFVNVGGSGHM